MKRKSLGLCVFLFAMSFVSDNIFAETSSDNKLFPYLGRISGTGSVVTGMTIVGGDGMLPIYCNPTMK